MRYFDDDKDNLMEMTDIEFMAFNTIAVNIDEAFGNYEERSEINKRNGSSGGRPRKNTNEENQKNQIGLEKTKLNQNKPNLTKKKQTFFRKSIRMNKSINTIIIRSYFFIVSEE